MSPHLLVLILLVFSNKSDGQDYDADYEEISVELELADMDLEDMCDKLYLSTKESLLLGTQDKFKAKISTEQDYGSVLRLQSERNRKFEESVPYDLKRNWTLQTKSGDPLLSEEDWNTLVSYYNANRELEYAARIHCLNGTQGCRLTKQGILDVIAGTRNQSVSQETWSAWQEVLKSSQKQFPSILQLVKKAVELNEQYDPTNYWEMLSEYPNAESKASAMWEEIEPLYLKLHEFVRVRINAHYNITNNASEIPVYLLGSNFGTDWSNIADIVLPHPQLYYDVLSELGTMEVVDIYEYAQNLSMTMRLGQLGEKFWSRSLFNFTSCDTKILSHCSKKFSEILTCGRVDWTGYLNAHETALKVSLRNQDYESLMRRNLRFSAVDEAIVALGSIFAITNLPFYGILPEKSLQKDDGSYEDRMTALLLIALRVLPQLPYYLAADKWRLEELNETLVNSTQQWWDLRRRYQAVHGVSDDEPDYLEDPYIISNKPYISKFLGVILQFQLLNHFESNLFDKNYNLPTAAGEDTNFIPFVQDRPNKDWLELLTYHYGIDAVSTNALLQYFKPLEEYLKNAPLEQAPVSIKQKIKTTPTTSTTTTTVPTSTAKLQDTKVTTEISPIQNDEQHKEEKTKVNSEKIATDEKVIADESSTDNKYVFPHKAAIYVGAIVVVSLVIFVGFVIVKKRLKKKQKTNNRRFET